MEGWVDLGNAVSVQPVPKAPHRMKWFSVKTQTFVRSAIRTGGTKHFRFSSLPNNARSVGRSRLEGSPDRVAEDGIYERRVDWPWPPAALGLRHGWLTALDHDQLRRLWLCTHPLPAAPYITKSGCMLQSVSRRSPTRAISPPGNLLRDNQPPAQNPLGQNPSGIPILLLSDAPSLTCPDSPPEQSPNRRGPLEQAPFEHSHVNNCW